MFKSKKVLIYSPVDGNALDLINVKDEVFANKMVGDGYAIIPESEYFCAPCNGTIKQIFPTNHAFGVVSDEGLEVLVHMGIDTVELKGEGYTRLKEPGDKVKAGDRIMKMDLELIKSNGMSTVTPIIFTNMDKVKKIKHMGNTFKTGDVMMDVTLNR